MVGARTASRAVVLVTVLAGVSCASGPSISSDTQASPTHEGHFLLVGTPEKAGYPIDWRVDSLSAAARDARFDFIAPSYGPVKGETIQDIFLFPGGTAIAIDYQSPVSEPERYVRQEYIEVYEATWTDNDQPIDEYKADMEALPDPAKSLTDIDGVPALVVEPHSKLADGQSNAAFLRFAVDGMEVQISGGEDLDLLESIARSMIESR